ncbi:PKD-like family lipoprotein [Chitinophaga sp. YIM B06452]|uniref:PKD-like family lipoprotein n=1 Tax=Chitinophaga sp. YIM B06452 TaxID=3082158 RepID=UPI0031FF2A2A
MKLIYQSLAACCMLLISSCYKDHGNYTYDVPEEITITGIAGTYDKVSLVDRITIDPQVSSSDPKAEFTYWWGIYETNVQGSAPKVDTIGRTKALDYLVTQPAKGWVLVFGAKNVHTGVSRIVTAGVNVITQFTRGWYVMKDDGAKTDVDLFLTPSGIVPASKTENVFSMVNNRKLDGEASLFGFYTNYKSNVTGTLANTRALFILSGKDASVVNINTFKEIHGLSGLFYETPSVKKPGSISEASQANYFVNGGHLHSIYSMSANVGLFGGKQLRDDNNSPYSLSKYFLAYSFYNPFFFDELSSSFVSATGTGSVLSAVTDAPGTEMPANSNNKELLFMGIKSTNPYAGVALFRDKTDPALKILSIITPSNFSLKMENDTLAATDKLNQAERFGMIVADENILYFSAGGEVWSRNLSNGAEQLQFTVPAGENITFIRHRKYAGNTTAEQPFYYNYILIGTTVNSQYKVRAFPKTSGNLAASPAFTMEGQGSVGDVIYLAPPMGNTTYPNSY